jgi:hypothetical protein
MLSFAGGNQDRYGQTAGRAVDHLEAMIGPIELLKPVAG